MIGFWCKSGCTLLDFPVQIKRPRKTLGSGHCRLRRTRTTKPITRLDPGVGGFLNQSAGCMGFGDRALQISPVATEDESGYAFANNAVAVDLGTPLKGSVRALVAALYSSALWAQSPSKVLARS